MNFGTQTSYSDNENMIVLFVCTYANIVSEFVSEWMSRWVHVCMADWGRSWVSEWVSGWLGAWMAGRVSELVIEYVSVGRDPVSDWGSELVSDTSEWHHWVNEWDNVISPSIDLTSMQSNQMLLLTEESHGQKEYWNVHTRQVG